MTPEEQDMINGLSLLLTMFGPGFLFAAPVMIVASIIRSAKWGADVHS